MKVFIIISTILVGISVILINTVFFPFLTRQYDTNIIKPAHYQTKQIRKSLMTKFAICPEFGGRLGNKMFIFASSFGVALEKRMSVEVDANNELRKLFKLTVGVRLKGSICDSGKIKRITERKSSSFDKKLLDFPVTSSVCLKNYLQSHLYFDKYKDEVRKQFTFKDYIQTQADSIINRLLRKHNILNRKEVTLIGVHVRRGDRARLSITKPKKGFKLATKEYMQKAVNWYKERYHNLLFLAASNGMDWTKKNMPKNIRVDYLENNTAAVDMAILASTDHMISTLGSYSWWSGWLTGGNVTYYQWPAADGGEYRKVFSKDFMDHYYKHWIGFS